MALDDRDYMRPRGGTPRPDPHYDPRHFRRNSAGHGPGRRAWLLTAATLAMLLACAGLALLRGEQGAESSILSAVRDLGAQSFPERGTVRFHRHIEASAGAARVQVQGSPGRDQDCVVRISDAQTKSSLIDVYVKRAQAADAGGSAWATEAPLPQGTLEAAVFCGKQWQGPARMFGPAVAPVARSTLVATPGSLHEIQLREKPDAAR